MNKTNVKSSQWLDVKIVVSGFNRRWNWKGLLNLYTGNLYFLEKGFYSQGRPMRAAKYGPRELLFIKDQINDPEKDIILHIEIA